MNSLKPLKLSLSSLSWLLPLVLVACATGHCRRDGQDVVKQVDPELPRSYAAKKLGTLMVAKADGSKKCDKPVGVSLKKMAQEQLQGVTIISSQKRHDGLVRIEACGVETGMLNAYEIRSQDRLKAQKAGFKVLEEE